MDSSLWKQFDIQKISFNFRVARNYHHFCIMPYRSIFLSVLISLVSFFSLSAQTELLTSTQSLPVTKVIIDETQSEGIPASGTRMVAIPINLYAASEVKLEIKDAFGNTQFESEAIYPEGENNIRVGVGNMQEGLYFVTLHSAWEEVKEIIIVERLR